jgi:phosphoenolpyruvate phosphomutase
MGITEIVIITGAFEDVLMNYCNSLNKPIHITYIKGSIHHDTNYIYSIYYAINNVRDHLKDDILIMHDNLVFEYSVLESMVNSKTSCMAISSTSELADKNSLAVIQKDHITKARFELGNNAVASQPLCMLKKSDCYIWLDELKALYENEKDMCYPENVFSRISDTCMIYPLEIKNQLCSEIDTPEDLIEISIKINEIRNRTVYMCFSTDIIHSAHISIIRKAEKLGKLIIGVLSDEAIVSYKRFPLLPFNERKVMFENISGVYKVVEQKTLSYKDNIDILQPTYIVHGDDWREGFQKPIRDEVVDVLATYGGILVEYPYSSDSKYKELEERVRGDLSLPDIRRARLRKIIAMKGTISVLEAHSGLTGLIAEKTVIYQNGGSRQFDAMWVSSLCDSTAKGKPDIELVDMTSRFRTIDDIMEVTTKPIIFDGDTGGLTEHFVYTVKTLERMGVSMIIIEDKTGLKKNSLFGTEVVQTQDTIENFSAKIAAGKKAQKTKDFMICARIESLILECGMEDALNRAFAFSKAGADAIMIHSRKKEPTEIFEFVEKFRNDDLVTPLVVVPTSFNEVTEDEFKERGVNVVIYANQLTRTGFPAMQNAAKTILENHRAKECDDLCMPFKEIINLIPEDVI